MFRGNSDADQEWPTVTMGVGKALVRGPPGREACGAEAGESHGPLSRTSAPRSSSMCRVRGTERREETLVSRFVHGVTAFTITQGLG